MNLKEKILNSIEESPACSLTQLAEIAPPDGIFLEFGVFQGTTINLIADVIRPKIIYGFDSFEGLPENWNGLNIGHFKVEVLPEVKDNVVLIKGMFQDTLQSFISNKQVSFIHIDCDLYSSTKCIFNNVKDKLVNNAIIVFDELYGYPDWEKHEYKAFTEFLEETKLNWECVGRYSAHQAGFKLYV